MELRDRGTKKWTSIMMPEQVAMLQKLWKEQDEKVMPDLDEQQIIANALSLQEAYDFEHRVQVKFFHRNEFYMTEGYILYMEKERNLVYMENKKLKFTQIIDVTIL